MAAPLPAPHVIEMLIKAQISSEGLSNLTNKTVRRSLETSLNLPHMSLEQHKEKIQDILDGCLIDFVPEATGPTTVAQPAVAQSSPVKRPREEPEDEDGPTRLPDGSLSWELGTAFKQIRISSFNGRVGVDIRTFYEKDGQHLPTKKGVFLSPNLWRRIIELAPRINAELEKMEK